MMYLLDSFSVLPMMELWSLACTLKIIFSPLPSTNSSYEAPSSFIDMSRELKSKQKSLLFSLLELILS